MQQTDRKLIEERRQRQSLETQLNNERKQRKLAEEKLSRYVKYNSKMHIPPPSPSSSSNRLYILHFIELTVAKVVNYANKCWKMNANN